MPPACRKPGGLDLAAREDQAGGRTGPLDLSIRCHVKCLVPCASFPARAGSLGSLVRRLAQRRRAQDRGRQAPGTRHQARRCTDVESAIHIHILADQPFDCSDIPPLRCTDDGSPNKWLGMAAAESGQYSSPQVVCLRDRSGYRLHQTPDNRSEASSGRPAKRSRGDEDCMDASSRTGGLHLRRPEPAIFGEAQPDLRPAANAIFRDVVGSPLFRTDACRFGAGRIRTAPGGRRFTHQPLEGAAERRF
jgi:hypothetical protein